MCTFFFGIYGFFAYEKTQKLFSDQINALNQNTTMQMGQNIDFLIDQARDTTLLIIQDQRIFEALKNDGLKSFADEQLIFRSLNTYVGQKDFIHSIYIQGDRISFGTSSTENNITPEMLSRAKALKGYFFFVLDTLKVQSKGEEEVFSLIRSMNNINNVTETMGIIKINIKKSAFAEIMDIKNDKYSGINYIVNTQGEYIIGQENDLIDFNDTDFDIETVKDPSMFKIKSENTSYTLSVYPIKNTDYYLCNLVNDSLLFGELYDLQESIVFAAFIGLLLALFIMFLFDRKVLSPLKKLKKLLKEVGNENFGVHIDHNNNDEIGLVFDAFNKMSIKLDQLLNQVYQKEIKKKEAELLALQAQINPHFLYNTMEMIYWTSRMEKAIKTSEMVHALSIHFRHTLNQGDFLTTVANEIEHCNSYLTIQKERLENLDYSIHCDADLHDIPVVNLILVTLVENSITHGFANMEKNCMIKVTIEKEEDTLIYRIEDNGQGCDEESIRAFLKDSESTQAFALRNINDRLNLAFNTQDSLEFYSQIGKGTTVIVRQPIGGKYIV